jgi:iron(III) transport system permease protein
MRITPHIVFLAMLVFFACFFVMPIWSTVQVAFVDTKGQFTLDYIWEVFRNKLYLEGLWNSWLMAFWSLVGCLALSLPLALLYHK